MTPEERFAAVRVARLATVDQSGAPHIVPITFALEGSRIVTAVDHKPKRSNRLKRLDNIAAEPRVTVLADHYDEDWSRLWWVRADGIAVLIEPGDPRHQEVAALLATKYDAYRDHPIAGVVIDIRVTGWSDWSS